jgi:hypothetical protein
MTTFDRREEAFESGFIHSEELRFRAEARRDRLIGLWAAEKMGLTGDAAAAYATTLIEAAVTEHGETAVFERIRRDFAAAGVGLSDHRIRRTMEEFLAEALRQMEAGGRAP